MLFRLIFFVAVISGVAIFTLSNMQPLVLTFLGFTTPGFPLSFWILGAIAAGMLTHAVISSLLHLTTYATAGSVRTQLQSQNQRDFSFDRRQQAESDGAKTVAASDDSVWRDWGGYEQAVHKSRPEPVDRPTSPASSSSKSEDDWEAPLSDDWEASSGEFRGVASPRNAYPRNQSVDRSDADTGSRTDFERPQEPKRASQSGSVYSYSYREPSAAPASPQQDRVVDADYRVIIPPYNPPTSSSYTPPPPPPAEENAEDWFEDDPPQPKPG